MKTRSHGVRVVLAMVGCLVTLGLASGVSQAQPASGPTAARRVRETMVVTGIDRANRDVTLQNADGETRTVGVPPDIKAFDTLKVGDHVDVDYYQSIGVALMPPGTKPSMTENSTGGRVAPGVGAARREITANVEVVSIDQVMNKVTFKGPKGNLRTVMVYDPSMQKRLANLQPGQMVQITYREAIAAAIKPTGSAR
jgi:hypothetical protein